MNYEDIIVKAGDHVRNYMRQQANKALLFHTPARTEGVVANAAQISRHEHLSHREHFITQVAAWFSEVGYYGDAVHHTAASTALAEGFLKTHGADAELVKEIRKCIEASDPAQRPHSLMEQVVADAVTYWYGTDSFTECNRLLRKELEVVQGHDIGKEEWRGYTIAKLEAHQYYTEYCRHLLVKKKKAHLDKLKRRAHDQHDERHPIDKLLEQEHYHNGMNDKEKLDTRVEKGTETLFRITSGVSQRLSEQADNKANILISVNSIIMSILLSIVVARLDRYPHLTIPIILFLTVNLVTITFSILATRPSVPGGTFEQGDVESRKVNLLFFGNFYRMHFDEYANGMYKVLGDKGYLYFSFIKNLYEHGVVLGRKYQKLKIAYNIFMYGIIVSVLAFVIASQFFAQQQ